MGSKYYCLTCKSSYACFASLKRHVKKLHPKSLSPLNKLKGPNSPDFACTQCYKKFRHAKSLQTHMKKHEPGQDKEKHNQKCCMCSFKGDKKDVLNHYKETHDILYSEKNLSFNSYNDFEKWKDDFENNTQSKFVREYSKTYGSCLHHSFMCHRSGEYVPRGNGCRRLKLQGSRKINALCPASIRLKKNIASGQCEVYVVETHLGHQSEICHLDLSKEERDYLASKIASKIPFEDILDEIQNSANDSNLRKLHTLRKKDLYNIENRYRLSRAETEDGALEIVCDTNKAEAEKISTENAEAEKICTENAKAEIICPEKAEAEKVVEPIIEQPCSEEKPFEQMKQEFIDKMVSMVKKIETKEQLEVCEQMLAPLEPTLAALQKSESKVSNPEVRHHNKIAPQRRIFITKKRCKENQLLSKPNGVAMNDSVNKTNAVVLKKCNNNTSLHNISSC